MPPKPPRLPRRSVLGRAISQHVREFHSEHAGQGRIGGSVTRRNFLRNTAGAAGMAFWIPEASQSGLAKGKSAEPRPIPGGVSPLGIFIHHFPAQRSNSIQRGRRCMSKTSPFLTRMIWRTR